MGGGCEATEGATPPGICASTDCRFARPDRFNICGSDGACVAACEPECQATVETRHTSAHLLLISRNKHSLRVVVERLVLRVNGIVANLGGTSECHGEKPLANRNVRGSCQRCGRV